MVKRLSDLSWRLKQCNKIFLVFAWFKRNKRIPFSWRTHHLTTVGPRTLRHRPKYAGMPGHRFGELPVPDGCELTHSCHTPVFGCLRLIGDLNAMTWDGDSLFEIPGGAYRLTTSKLTRSNLRWFIPSINFSGGGLHFHPFQWSSKRLAGVKDRSMVCRTHRKVPP